MTIATVDAPQPEVTVEPATEAKEDVKVIVSTDPLYLEVKAEIMAEGERLRNVDTTTRLRLARRVRDNTEAILAKHHGQRASWPKDRARQYGIFAGDYAAAFKSATTDKEVYSWVRTVFLEDWAKEKGISTEFASLDWSIMVAVARWVRFNPVELTYSLGVVVPTDDDKETFIDPSGALARIIRQLADTAPSVASTRKLLNDAQDRIITDHIESQAGAARKRLKSAIATQKDVARAKEITSSFAAFVEKATKTYFLDAQSILERLMSAGLKFAETTADFDPSALSTMSADDARLAAKLMIQNGDFDAIVAMFNEFRPHIANANASQPSKCAGETLGGSSRILNTANAA